MELHESTENYLESILIIKEAQGYVRSVDIAIQLEVTKASVSYAVKKLKEQGFITLDTNGMISLTKEGLKIATSVYTRHKTLIDFFMTLGVDGENAKIDACKVEHDISEKTFSCICKFLKNKKH